MMFGTFSGRTLLSIQAKFIQFLLGKEIIQGVSCRVEFFQILLPRRKCINYGILRP
jgi:hypothetical protein